MTWFLAHFHDFLQKRKFFDGGMKDGKDSESNSTTYNDDSDVHTVDDLRRRDGMSVRPVLK